MKEIIKTSRKITLQGLLYDEKSSFLRGSSKAPPLIRQAFRSDSANYYAENGMEITPDTFEDLGDFEIIKYADLEKVTSSNLNNHNIITLGGDHSITYPVIKALNKKIGPIDILHIDAHSDLYDSFEGDKFSHACPFARIMEEGLANRLVQLGIRTLNRHQREQAERFEVEIIEMKDFDLRQLPQFENQFYLSLDLDALDPAFAPGVSHHEPGGFTTRQLLQLIQHLKGDIIGADIVEYNPERDVNGMTAMLGAKFLKEIAAKMLEN